MAEEMTPVYLFTGFLEAGKTKFIQSVLEDERFNAGEHILLLLCEEGEEEYDPTLFSGQNVYTVVVDSAEELTPENLSNWANAGKAERIVIEYNGMWQLDDLFRNLPDDWGIAQEFTFFDSTTTMVYNANMRQLVVDKLQSTELVVFNRCAEETDTLSLHKLVRGINTRCDIIYEDEEGKIAYDEYKDPLPFDIDAPVITIEDRDYAIWYRDMVEDQEKYVGKKITFKGIAAVDAQMNPGTFALGRHVMTCCVEDIKYMPVACRWAGAEEVKMEDWLQITATITIRYSDIYGRKGPVMLVEELHHCEAPEQEVATFY